MIELRVLGASALTGRDDQTVGSVLHQPKRLALLTYLAMNASGSLVRRDRLLALFWPDSSEARARSSLSEALSRLRSSLGASVVVTRGHDEVGLHGEAIWCDAAELRRAADAGDWHRVQELYGGPFLDGLILDGLPDFERWLEATRAQLARAALDAAGRVADEALARGDDEALALAERALEIDPFDGDAVSRVMTLLAHDGHRSAALSLFERFSANLRARRGVAPAASVVALGEAIREGRSTTRAGPEHGVTSPWPPAQPRELRVIDTRGVRRRLLEWLTAAVAALILVFVARNALEVERLDEVRRYALGMPPGEGLSPAVLRPRVALSPDGRHLLYVAGREDAEPMLYLRPRDELQATSLPGTVRATNPFLSPDGRRFGYLRGPGRDQAVMLGSFNGEPPTELVDSGVGLAGATWSADGRIYYDGVTAGGTTGLMRVHELGGPAEQVTTVDTAGGEIDHVWPSALPDGRGIVFTILREGGPEVADVAVLDLRTRERRVLVRALSARYVAPGYLLFLRSDGALTSVEFDLDRLSTRGMARTLASGVGWRLNGATDVAVSASGTLVYVPGHRTSDPAELVWVDRQGRIEPLEPRWRGDFATLALSPDGSHVALSRLPATWFDVQEIFVRDLTTGATARLAGGAGVQNFKPAWLRDGRTVAFLSDRAGKLEIWARPIDRPDEAELVLRAASPISDFSVAPHDDWIVYVTDGDIFARHLREGRPLAIAASAATETLPAISPDGRWLAYTSDESGRSEVYVASFPASESARRLVSVGGGTGPVWGSSGLQIYYATLDDALALVQLTVDSAGRLRGGEPTTIRPHRPRWRNGSRGRGFAVSDDGQRILAVVADSVTVAEELIVTDGVRELLRRLHEG